MVSLSEDIQCAGSDTRPPMLDRIDFASWQQRPFQIGTFRETLAEGTECGPHLCPERPRVYSDLPPEDKERMQLNSKFMNNMLPECGRFVTAVKLNRGLRDSNYDQLFVTAVKLNRGLRDSNYDQLYAYLKQYKAHANENKMMLDRFTQHTVDPLALMSNNRGQGNNARGGGTAGYGGAQNRVGNVNPGSARQIKCYNCNDIGHIARNYTQPKRPQNSKYFKDKMLLMQAQENEVALDEEQLLFLAGGQDNTIDEDVDEQPVQDLALNVDNVFQADDCDAFDSDVDEAPTAQTMFMANLSSADPVYDEAGPSYDSDILSEVHDHDHYQDAVCEHHEEHEMHDDVQPTYVVDSHADYTSDSNMILYDQYVKDNAVPEQVELYERRARFELTEREQKIDEQLRIVITDRNIKEENLKKELHSVKMQLASTINHNKSMVEEVTSLKKDFKQKENKYLEEFLDMKALKEKVEDKLYKQDQSLQTVHMLCKPKPYYNEQNKITQLTEKVSVLQEQNELFRAKNEKVKQHYKELYDSIKIVRAKHIEQTTALLIENENLKAQIHENLKCNTMESVKPRVLAPGRYAIDVELIPPHNRNNREVYLYYLKHLKESVETLREIVEEAKVERPLDRSTVFACRYTKHSQELLEYAISTCPKAFNQRDKKQAPNPLIRKKVNCCTNASGSQPKSNTKKNRISPAKCVNKKKVEEHPRTNKSNLRTMNHVDSSSSSKRTIINSNLDSVCQTCNKCLIFVNHDVCVVDYLQSVKASHSIHNIHNVVRKVKQVWKPKQVRQVWKLTGKVLTSVGHQWRPIGRIFTLGEQCPLTRPTKPKVAPAKQNENQAITCANQ
ncbi:retrovirus-related pol polyprotein from transposon TNT 1-94 [Tanacetum coccineum]